MGLLNRKQVVLSKIENLYSVDSIPTGAANAMLVSNLKATPMQLEAQARGLFRPYLGNDEDIVTAFYGMLEFDVEVAGAGALGTVPKFGALLRACSMAEVITVSVKVAYTPVSTAFESVSMYFYLDGVLHKMLGARGDVSVEFKAKNIPKFKFKFMGLFVPVTDVALPVASYTGFITPVAVNKANTTYSLHTISTPLSSLSIKLNNDVKYRNLVNYEAIDIINRTPDGSAEFEAGLMASKNWFTVARDVVLDVMTVTHGTTAGNVVFMSAPKVQITSPKYGDIDGIASVNTGLKLMPSLGNDELLIEVR